MSAAYQLQKRFTETETVRAYNACSKAAVICGVGHLLYPIADYFVVPGSIVPILVVRAVFLLLFLGQFAWLRMRGKASEGDPAVMLAVATLSIVGVSLATGVPSSEYILVLALPYVASAVFLPLSGGVFLSVWLGSIAVYNIAAFPLDMVASTSRLAMIDSYLLLSVVAAYIIHRLDHQLRLEGFSKNEELVAASESLKLAVQRLQERDQEKNVFFANVSHELRTPLTLILAPLDAYLARQDIDDGGRQQLEISRRNGVRLSVLVDELLDLAKLDSATDLLQGTAFDLARALRELVKQAVLLAQRHDIALTFVPGDDYELKVVADVRQIERVCLNLISNALKYTNPQGQVRVDVFERGGQAHVVVSDTGIGIKPQDLPRIFDRFFQVKSENRRGRGGVGIGLSLCQKIVALHHGAMTAESEPRRGSRIGFWIPRLGAPELTFHTATSPMGFRTTQGVGLAEWNEALKDRDEYKLHEVTRVTERRVASRGAPGTQVPKVLVVEDNPDIIELIDSLLSGEYTLYTAMDGKRGLEAVDRFRPDLVLTDLMMPIMTGDAMIKQLRTQEYGATVPIVALTARGAEDDRLLVIQAGADAILSKPFNREELLSVLRTLLRRQVLTRKNADDERYLALRAMAGGIAHEILNPVALVRTNLFLIKREYHVLKKHVVEHDETKKAVVNMDAYIASGEEGIKRTVAAVEPLRKISRGTEHEGALEKSSIDSILDAVIRVTDSDRAMKVIKDAKQPVMAQIGQVEQVLINLIVNAQQACGDTHRQPIELRSLDDTEGRKVIITVTDHGPGMSAETQSHIFDPYFTTKASGTGLGLHVCRQIVARHGGQLSVQSDIGQGATFTVTLPSAWDGAGATPR